MPTSFASLCGRHGNEEKYSQLDVGEGRGPPTGVLRVGNSDPNTIDAKFQSRINTICCKWYGLEDHEDD